MNLKCKIHGKEFPIVQGVTFSEEYNETLDSGSLIITHVSKIRKLRPYNDVFVFDNEFNGFGENLNPRDHNKFYKHMLVQNFTEEVLNLKDKIYKYKISLMSEIKALEKVQLPNISVTQPLKAKYKVSVYEYLVRFVKMYSPKYKKVISGTKKWKYVQKYTVDPELQKVFGDVYSPDFTLNLPTLRDLISKLMIVKDMIPYVEDNVIKAMDITARKNEFVLDEKHMNYITGSMHNEDYCTGLRRTYSDALSQDSTCRSIEYIGFRNSDSALMTLDNMRLETRFPIYKINKIYMCYYKKATVKVWENNYLSDKFFLCKQDITPLVKLTTERNALSQDWNKFKDKLPTSIEEMAQYKMCTVGYDIGSKYITGWGTKFTYPIGWWKRELTYVENILRILDDVYEYGDIRFDQIIEKLISSGVSYGDIEYRPNGDFFESVESPFTNKALDLKSMIFIVDYQGFYNGAIETSKDNIEDDGIISNDNSSSSLALLELDGLSQKEKVNRFGNKTIQISARYEDISQMQNLGDVYNNEDDTDVVIYHREYSIYDNLVNCIYFGVKDYVLKNYYTSVFARHRTWNLIPYSQSVRRSENKKNFLTFSKKTSYYEKESNFNISKIDSSTNLNKLLLSAFESTKFDVAGKPINNFKVNYGFFTHKNNYYLSEVNSFLHGDSLCFNISMLDNISMGNYISDPSPFNDNSKLPGEDSKWSELQRNWFDVNKDFSGSVQDWYSIVDNEETGFTEKLGFYLAHNNSTNQFFDDGLFYASVDDIYNNYLFKLPKIDNLGSISNQIGNEFEIYKDNKEFVDMTYQIEPISLDEDVLFSSWLMKLNDLLGNYLKIDSKLQIESYIPPSLLPEEEISKAEQIVNFYAATYVSSPEPALDNFLGRLPYIVVSIDIAENDNLDLIEKSLARGVKPLIISDSLKWGNNYKVGDILYKNALVSYEFLPTYISQVTDNSIIINGTQKLGILMGTEYSPVSVWDSEDENVQLIFERIKDNSDTSKVYYYARVDFIKTEDTYSDEYPSFEYRAENDEIFVSNSKDRTYPGNPPLVEPSSDNFEITNSKLYFGEYIYDSSKQNMFIVTSDVPLKNTLVYDEYSEKNFFNKYNLIDLKPKECFEVNKNYIEINIKKIKENIQKNIFYKFDNTIKTTNDIDPGKDVYEEENNKEYYFYCTFTSVLGVEYDRITFGYKYIMGYYMTFRNKLSQEEETVYFNDSWENEMHQLLKTDIAYQKDNLKNIFLESQFNEWKNKNLKAIQNDISKIQSIQYWYKDVKKDIHDDKDKLLKFVFGINLSDEDKQKDSIKIYTSLISNRNPNVYDENYNIVGKVHNYANNEDFAYGEDQYYDEEDID